MYQVTLTSCSGSGKTYDSNRSTPVHAWGTPPFLHNPRLLCSVGYCRRRDAHAPRSRLNSYYE